MVVKGYDFCLTSEITDTLIIVVIVYQRVYLFARVPVCKEPLR